MDNKLSFIGIIPARYDSSRFPGKPLAKIGEKTMIERVWTQAKKALENVCVATDDFRIFEEVKRFGGDVVMTDKNHQSGTDRCYEAYLNFGSNADVIINIQGDEPFIHKSQILELKKCFNSEETDIATLARKFDADKGFEHLADWTKPKVVFDNNFNALLFSRSVIPFVRNIATEEWAKHYDFYMHVGMYAYRANVLKEITRLERSSLEIAESLEQLRWLQNGYNIKVGITQLETIGIDTPDDLKRAISFLSHE